MMQRFKPPELIKALEHRWLNEADEWLRLETAIAFGRYDVPDVRRAVLKGIHSENPGILADSLYLGMDLRPLFDAKQNPDVLARYLSLMSHANDRVRNVAVRALSHRAPRLLLPHAKRLAADTVLEIRCNCILAIRDCKDPAQLHVLLRLLDDPDERVQERAFDALGSPGYATGLPKVAPYLRSEKQMYWAQWAIVGMGGKAATAALMEELRQGNRVGDTIFQALEKLTGKRFGTDKEALAWWAAQKTSKPQNPK